MDLSTYVLVGRYDLPEPTRTPAPAGSVLAQEVSAVTYNWDTNTLFVVGDGGTSIVQISKTGQLINSMTLAAGSSPQGTEFYDPEGLTYIGNNQFVMTEERDRNAVLFTYEAGGTLIRSETHTVDLGTFVPNIGLEGLTYDPLTNGFIFVKETQPEGIFQTAIDFIAGTASNGSPTTENSVDLFNPSQLGLLDFADVYALSSNALYAGTSEAGNLLVLSQEQGVILEVDRSGNILSSLTIVSNPGNPLSVPSQQHEGLTMDANGFLYVVSENGGGDFDHPQVWVYAPSDAPNAAPTGITLTNALASIDENTGTVARVKVAGITVADDGIGTNVIGVTGADAAVFEADGTGLYFKAGTVLDFETKASYSVTVTVNDPTVGNNPDASTNYSITINDIAVENGPPVVFVSEVAPWSSGNSPVGADWFEVTNGGSSTIDLSGWRMDDNSFAFAASVALTGVASLAPGKSAIFVEGNAATVTAFIADWFGGVLPVGVQVGSYSGGGVSLSTGGDGVVLFNGAGEQQAKVSFGTSPASAPFGTFDNSGGLNDATITTLSKVGLHGAFNTPGASDEIGSPGTVGRLIISEVAPWASGNSPVGADWFELTNTSAFAIDITGWKMDDGSQSFAAATLLNGVTSIAPGESVIFIETTGQATVASFRSTWFGSNPPAGLQIGTYSGGSLSLSTGGDGVAIFNATGVLQAQVSFGASPGSAPFTTFDNAAGLTNTTVTSMSTVGVNAAFVAIGDPAEIGSPGEIAVVNDTPSANDDAIPAIGENAPAQVITFATLLSNDKAGPATEAAQALTITSVGSAVGGTVQIDGSAVVFAPTAGFSGTASFVYTARDNGQSYGQADFRSDTATVMFLVDAAPNFTSPAAISTPENHLVVGTVAATDAEGGSITLALSGGADAGFFVFDSDSGQLSFAATPDFETPEDTDHDNVYVVEITAQDSFGNHTTQHLSVSVADVAEAGITIVGGNGGGAINGGVGNDAIAGGNGNDLVNAGDGDDTVAGGNGTDQLLGGRGADTLDGGNGNDWLDGAAGADTLVGGNGDDRLIGGAGVDQLSGGNGADTFSFALGDSTSDAFDMVLDFNGREGDRIDLSAFGIEQSDIVLSGSVASYFATVDVDGNGSIDFAVAIHAQTPLSAEYFIV